MSLTLNGDGDPEEMATWEIGCPVPSRAPLARKRLLIEADGREAELLRAVLKAASSSFQDGSRSSELWCTHCRHRSGHSAIGCDDCIECFLGMKGVPRRAQRAKGKR